MVKRLKAFAAAALLAAAALTPAGAMAQTGADEPTLAVTTQQARAIARQALAEGNPQLADAISSALLARDPDDAEALFVRALLLRATGRLDAAADAAAASYRNAEGGAARFEAAMVMADLLARQERFMRAQVWLRRADQAAPDDARQATAARAYAALRQRNPLQVGLRFSLKPSNNVNNGAETTVIEVGGLPFRIDDSGQQLGGWEASAGVSLAYRLSETRTEKTEVLGEVFFRKAWLDSDAKALAPGVRASDLDYGVLAGGVRHQRLIWPGLGLSSVTFVVGQSWYGGEDLARWGDVQLSQTVRRSDRAALRFTLSGRAEKRLDDEINDSRSLGLAAEYIATLEGGAAYSLGASLRNIWSDSATVDGLVTGINASWSPGTIGPVQPRVSLTAENRDYQKWSATASGREDRTLSLRVDLTWPEISYYGFAPQATLTARRTWSEVDIYDRNELSLGLTAVSRF